MVSRRGSSARAHREKQAGRKWSRGLRQAVGQVDCVQRLREEDESLWEGRVCGRGEERDEGQSSLFLSVLRFLIGAGLSYLVQVVVLSWLAVLLIG